MKSELEFWSDLSVKLRELREKNGLTQPDVADRIEIGVSAYKSYELGARRIPVDVLVRVAALYNISMDDLLGNSVKRDASTNIIHGNFTKEQIQKIQKYADLVRNNEL